MHDLLVLDPLICYGAVFHDLFSVIFFPGRMIAVQAFVYGYEYWLCLG